MTEILVGPVSIHLLVLYAKPHSLRAVVSCKAQTQPSCVACFPCVPPAETLVASCSGTSKAGGILPESLWAKLVLWSQSGCAEAWDSLTFLEASVFLLEGQALGTEDRRWPWLLFSLLFPALVSGHQKLQNQLCRRSCSKQKLPIFLLSFLQVCVCVCTHVPARACTCTHES